MKKIILILIMIMLFLLTDATISYAKKEKIIVNNYQEIKAIYISYLEYYDHFYGNSIKVNQTKIDKMIDNIKSIGFNTIFLQVSPFSDSIYESKLFPYSITLTGKEGKNPGFDYLEYFLKKAHQNKMSLHAWINPYRISFDNNTDSLSSNNPAIKLLNTSNIKIGSNGIYYNPASEIVKNLLLRQIQEIIDNYQVDGIHFDDYFYVQNDIDKLEYDNYLKNNKYLSLKDFRLLNTNDLIKKVYKLIKEKNSNILFSIAPDGNINNNYQYHYADVKKWMKENAYLDIIMPQIYYGFENEYSPFEHVLNDWLQLKENENIKIMPVLAFYKCGTIDNGAGKGLNEWLNNDDIIKRQISYLKENNINEYALFRYDFLFNDKYLNTISVKEKEKIKKITQNYG